MTPTERAVESPLQSPHITPDQAAQLFAAQLLAEALNRLTLEVEVCHTVGSRIAATIEAIADAGREVT